MLKDNLIAILESNRGLYISGEELSKQLSVTRSAVWKAIGNLRKEGYEISAVTNKGYMLSSRNDVISEQSIRPFLKGQAASLRFDIRKSLPSTNTELKRLAADGEEQGLVLIANEQTGGRGRMGRNFYSPADSGIYMSLLLRPSLKAQDSPLLTSMVAVSAARAIENVTGIKVGIKWVNDLYYNGKKIAGILTEGGIGVESGTFDYVVVGIGVNVFTDVFPDDIKNRAFSITGFLKGSPQFTRSLIIAEILNQFFTDLPHLEKREHIREYKNRSVVIGKEITVLKNGTQKDALALDIDENASLTVKYPDGFTEALSSNDISLKI